jgi:nucleotide-binding universal stress UspA family protein
VAALPLPPETLELVDAGPAPALIAGADRSSVVVLGSRGHGRVSGALTGSVSQHVAINAPCSVVVVREQSSPESKRVVVGVDASEGGGPALRFAFEHAERTGAELTAVHVLQTWAAGPPYASRYVSDRFAHTVAQAEPLIDQALSADALKHPSVVVDRQVVAGSVGRVLSDASEEASLLVVGSRGRGAFASMLLGSVALSVLHHARCPVVIAR